MIIWRSEEHTSELQSHVNLVCRLLLEKKKKKTISRTPTTFQTSSCSENEFRAAFFHRPKDNNKSQITIVTLRPQTDFLFFFLNKRATPKFFPFPLHSPLPI